jgi:hypothetical protein
MTDEEIKTDSKRITTFTEQSYDLLFLFVVRIDKRNDDDFNCLLLILLLLLLLLFPIISVVFFLNVIIIFVCPILVIV